MSNGKAIVVHVCRNNVSRSTYFDANPHIVVHGNLNMEYSRCIACSLRCLRTSGTTRVFRFKVCAYGAEVTSRDT
jgi:hypothetical protein